MSAEDSGVAERVKCWNERWNEGQIGFHKTDVHTALIKHFEKLSPEKPNKVLVPLCGKSVDMKWLANQGLKVVGIDGVKKALTQFFSEQGVEYSEVDTSQKRHGFKLIQSKDGLISLYCGDMLNFTSDVEGVFDAMWDRGSLVALDRKDVPAYVETCKKLMSPNGRILVEVMEYDISIMDDVEDPVKPPPPFPVYEDELKQLYGPECTVEFLDRDDRTLAGKDIKVVYYLIARTS